MKKPVAAVLAVASLCVLSGPVLAQAYPAKPVTIVVTTGPGAGSDILCRQFGDAWSKQMGQTFIVENRPGGDNVIATDYMVRSAPDGYTVLCVAAGSMGGALHKSLPWTFTEVADPVVQIFRIGVFLLASGKLPVSDAQEFMTYVRAHPGQLNYYSVAPSLKIAMAVFLQKAGLNMVEISYKSGQARTDLIANVVQAGFDGPAGLGGQIDSGQIKPLFVAAEKRAPLYPNVPTAAEVGLKDLVVYTGLSFWAPKGTPKEAIAKLNATFNAALKTPEIKAIIDKAGGEVMGGTPEDLLRNTRAEHAVFAEGARIAKYVPE